jgi:hypothetical protein
MADFIFLMHNDATQPTQSADWAHYITSLRAGKHFAGGSALGGGTLVKSDAVSDAITSQIVGYMVINASDIEEAKRLARENPACRAGGTVEVRHLPRT